MCVTICGRFYPDEDAIAGSNRIRVEYTAKWACRLRILFSIPQPL
ncbi:MULTISPECIES: DUF6783 domain-containing protein [Clostridia]|nr:DUF6783 domain-containing protein [Blautia faecis]